jgi:hypothetical protein
MKILNAPEYAELILPDRRIHFTDKLELKENGYVVELKRISRSPIETQTVKISIEEDKVKVGKYEIGLDDCIRFTVKGIKVEIYKL